MVAGRKGVQHDLTVRQALHGGNRFSLRGAAQDALAAAVGQQGGQGALPQGGVRVRGAHLVHIGRAQLNPPGGNAAAGLGLGGHGLHGGEIVDVQKFKAVQPGAVGGAPKHERGDAALLLRVEAGQPPAHAVADQRGRAGAVGALHVQDRAFNIIGHVGKRIGGERLGAVAAAGEIQPYRGDALRGQLLRQRGKVAVTRAAARKAVAKHGQRHIPAAGQLARQLHRGVNGAPRAGDADILRGRGAAQQRQRRRNAERQRGNAAGQYIKRAFLRLIFHGQAPPFAPIKPYAHTDVKGAFGIQNAGAACVCVFVGLMVKYR